MIFYDIIKVLYSTINEIKESRLLNFLLRTIKVIDSLVLDSKARHCPELKTWDVTTVTAHSKFKNVFISFVVLHIVLQMFTISTKCVIVKI